jgi:hypothetical protein
VKTELSDSVRVRKGQRLVGFYPRAMRSLEGAWARSRKVAMLTGALALFAPLAAFAQGNALRPRITAQIDETKLTTLRGNTHPLARPQNDQGAVADSQPLHRMLLLLQRSPEQETALRTLIDQQQSKSSPNFHRWLTPQQFGQQFGAATADIQTVTNWLQSHGFQIARVATGGTVIEFSGTAGQVRNAFHTEIHRYFVNGEQRFANSSDPQIPAALAAVVAGPVSLYNFPRKAQSRTVGAFRKDTATGKITPIPSPNFVFSNSGCTSNPVFASNCNAVGPGDFGAIYNVNPLWTTGIGGHVIDGSNQTIAIVGDSEICTQSSPAFGTCTRDDVADFRGIFGLSTAPANLPTVILDGPDPGFNSDEIEGDLDVEWSGAIAKNAKIDFVIAESTEVSEGTDLAAEYVVDNNLAPVVSESFGTCEAFIPGNGNLFEYSLWEQAAAQGITAIVSTGDSGSAGCDDPTLPSPNLAVNGANVNGVGSTPFNVAVGGTDFDISATNYPAAFWSATNSPVNGIPGVSVKGYVPETTWNDSCARVGPGSCTPQGTLLNISGGGGGQSNCVVPSTDNFGNVTCLFNSLTNGSIPGWTKPAYQPVASGSGLTLLTDQTRDVPDISLFSGDGSISNSFYIVCQFDFTGAPCAISGQINFVAVGGTSAAAPSFAGMMALVNQNMVVNHAAPAGQGQGNANYVLYPLFAAQQTASLACNSSSSPVPGCTFNDVTKGSNSVPCAAGSFECSNTGTSGIGVVEAGIPTSSTPSFPAGTGYDLATGLGSVNAFNLVSNWPATVGAFTPTTTTLCLSLTSGGCASSSSPSTISGPITHGTQVFVSIGVTETGNSTKPPAATLAQPEDAALIGTFPAPCTSNCVQGVDLLDANTGNADNYQLGSGGAVTGSTTELVGGTYTVSARYGGDGKFGSSASTPGVPITVVQESSVAKTCVIVVNPVTGQFTGQVLTAPYSCSSATTAQYGDLIEVRADVIGASGLQTATGSVALTDNGSAIVGPNGPAVSSFLLNTEGYLEDQTAFLAPASHSFVATYTGASGSGDASYHASAASSATSFTVTQCNTSATITTASTTIQHGTPITIGALIDSAVAGNPSGGSSGANMGGMVTFTTPTQSVTFPVAPPPNWVNWLAGGTISSLGLLILLFLRFRLRRSWVTAFATMLLAVILGTSFSCGGSSGSTGGGGGGGTTTLGSIAPTATTDANGFVAGQASITITPAATETITVTYSGDANYKGSTSTSVTITVQ